MSDFACMEDWGLQAVVRGYINEAPSTILAYPNSFSTPLSSIEDDLFSFPEISETTTVLDELQKIYTPSYPVLHPLSSQTMLVSSISVPQEAKEPEKQQSKKEPATKYRRSRKNQHKRVVQHVTAEGLCSDIWAWRKYGQKPIKGSPNPRSYYRCSSSKGCPARKQVERSHLDPEVFIVSYTSEHNHSHPTRRNSLAGSTRSKFPTPKKKANRASPTTPLISSIEDEFVQSVTVKNKKILEQMVQDNEGNDIVKPDLVLDNDIFPSLEDFDELNEQPALDACFLDQLLEVCSPGFIDGH